MLAPSAVAGSACCKRGAPHSAAPSRFAARADSGLQARVYGAAQPQVQSKARTPVLDAASRTGPRRLARRLRARRSYDKQQRLRARPPLSVAGRGGNAAQLASCRCQLKADADAPRGDSGPVNVFDRAVKSQQARVLPLLRACVSVPLTPRRRAARAWLSQHFAKPDTLHEEVAERLLERLEAR